MSRSNPHIQAQREILQQLLQVQPKAEDFDQEDIAAWQRIGMGPKYFLDNGIQAYAQVIEQMIRKLDTEEEEWRNTNKSEGADPL
jgi:hypothetical protein